MRFQTIPLDFKEGITDMADANLSRISELLWDLMERYKKKSDMESMYTKNSAKRDKEQNDFRDVINEIHQLMLNYY